MIHRFPIDIVLSVPVAWASYRLIERPCLRLRDRWWPARGTVSGRGVQADRHVRSLGDERVMRVSVVMPVYNAAATVARALDSILAQSRAPDEIIVVDDGSVDNSADIVARLGGSRVGVLHQENGGAARARNAGIAKATGDIVALLDADDWWEPAKVSRQIEVFERHPEVVAVASSWNWNEVTPGLRPAKGNAFTSRECGCVLRAAGDDVLRFAFSMATSTVAARREVLRRHRFDEGLVSAEDRDVWVRLVAEGPVWFEEAALATISVRADSLSDADPDRDCACMLEVLGRYAHLAGRRAIRRWEGATHAKWAGRLLSEGRSVEARAHAWERWRRERWNPQAWWVLTMCRWQARGGAHGSQ